MSRRQPRQHDQDFCQRLISAGQGLAAADFLLGIPRKWALVGPPKWRGTCQTKHGLIGLFHH